MDLLIMEDRMMRRSRRRKRLLGNYVDPRIRALNLPIRDLTSDDIAIIESHAKFSERARVLLEQEIDSINNGGAAHSTIGLGEAVFHIVGMVFFGIASAILYTEGQYWYLLITVPVFFSILFSFANKH